jgi:DNA-binding winged helix-turn-helix (wHTH) protein
MQSGCDWMFGKLQFGVYELDRDAMELRKHGLPLRLQEQPFRILAALVERPGQIVTREELQELIWGKDTFVDFEQSLNKAVNRVREALNDDAGHPQYVETIPRRGYRFIAPVTGNTPAEQYRPTPPQAVVSGLDVRKSGPHEAWSRKTVTLAIAGLLAAMAGITAIAMFGKWVKPGLREPQHITSSGFGPTLSRDGKLLAYVSNLRDNVPHIWLKQTAGGEATQVTGGSDQDFAPDFSHPTARASYSLRRGEAAVFTSRQPSLVRQNSSLAARASFPVSHLAAIGSSIGTMLILR